MSVCDHDYESRYCDTCGKFLGQECNACGDWYDGGDYMAAQPELWCECGLADYRDELRRARERFRDWPRPWLEL